MGTRSRSGLGGVAPGSVAARPEGDLTEATRAWRQGWPARGSLESSPAPPNNEMNLTNRGVPGMKERPASGEPVLAEVGRPVILSLGVAGYFSVRQTLRWDS
jgi:hypothetical protein